MKLSIEIYLEGAAFDDTAEIKNLLAQAANEIRESSGDRGQYMVDGSPIVESNGNVCGWWKIEG